MTVGVSDVGCALNMQVQMGVNVGPIFMNFKDGSGCGW